VSKTQVCEWYYDNTNKTGLEWLIYNIIGEMKYEK